MRTAIITATLLISSSLWADSFVLSDTQAPSRYSVDLNERRSGTWLDNFANTYPKSYEQYRLDKVKNAKSLEEFLKWATPTEIADDLSIDPKDYPLAEMPDRTGYGEMGKRYFEIDVTVHRKSNRMDVEDLKGELSDLKDVPISVGRPGYPTDLGCNFVYYASRNHWSKQFQAPMGLSLFFHGGEALHVGNVNVASHGCVHLTRAVATRLFDAHTRGIRVCVTED